MNEFKKIIRDENGLIQGINYPLTEEGLIDWKAMIKREFLVVNRLNFESRNLPVPPSIDGLSDKDLLITLIGFRNLAQVRGFMSINYDTISPSENMVITTCSIKFIPNFETENREIIFSAIGDATISNTNGFGKMFLGSIAENRSFVRCVRNFLRIPILGADELGPKIGISPIEASSGNGNSLLEELMKQHNISFQVIKNTLIKDKFEDADKITCVSEIPKHKQLEIIGKIKKKFEIKTNPTPV